MRKAMTFAGVAAALLVAGSAFAAGVPVSRVAAPVRPAYDKWEIVDMARRGELPAGTYRAAFDKEEVDGLIDAALAMKNVRWFVDAATADFNDDGSVAVRAHVLRPFKGWVSAVGVPTVEDGKVRIEIGSARYGYFPVPSSFAERVGNFLLKKQSPDEWLAVPGVRWDELKVGKDGVSFAITAAEAKQ